MELSKNNISKFERIIQEEWNLLQEQAALGGGGYMAGPGGSMSIDGPKTTRFRSAVGGTQDISANKSHDFFNWMSKNDPSLYMSLQADFDAYWSTTHPEEANPEPPKKPNWSMGTPGSEKYHDNLYKAWKAGAFMQSNSGIYGKLHDKIYAAADKAPASLKSVTYASKFEPPTKPGELAKITQVSAADVAAAELLDDALTPEPSGKTSQANSIKNTSAKESEDWIQFLDDEKAAFKLVKRFSSTIRDYYWLNLRICQITGYNSIIEFLISFSNRRSRFGSDAKLEDWVRSLAYRENMGLALVEIEEKDWDDLLQHLYELQDSNPEVWNLAHYDTNKLDSIPGFEGLKSAISNKLLPLRDHIRLITEKQAKMIQQKKDLEIQKSLKRNIGKFNSPVTQWIVDYLDEDPTGALDSFALVAGVFGGWIGMALAAAAQGTKTKIEIDRKQYGAAGNDAFWTAVWIVGAALKIPYVQYLRTSSKIKIANAWAKSDLSILNQLESRVFSNIVKEATKVNGKFQKEISTLLRSRFVNNFKNSALGKEGVDYLIYRASTKSKNLLGDIIKFVNNSKYIATGYWAGWNWYTEWWPDIYENGTVPAFLGGSGNLTWQEVEFNEQVVNLFEDMDEYSIYDKNGKYVGPTDEEALGN